MKETTLGNLRFLVHHVSPQVTVNEILNVLDEMAHSSPNTELLDGEVYLIYKDKGFLLGRAMVGHLSFSDDSIQIFDVSDTEIIKTELDLKSEKFSEALEEIKQFCENNQLFEFISNFQRDNWTKLAIAAPKSGTFKWL